MSRPRIIDSHTHILTEETMLLLRKEAPKLGIGIAPLNDSAVVLEVAGSAYKPFPRGGFDLEQRFKDMVAMAVDMQVLSATPQTYLYNQEAALGAVTSAIQNDQIAKLVKAQPDRFVGIATLPMQDGERAAAELRRAVTKLGLKGAMIGSNVQGKNLDDPAFEPLWQTAAELDAFIFIHPVTVAGSDRLKPYYLVNLVGNPLDTTIAAACLVFGGVFDRYPKLKVCLAHGGGFVPFQAGRWAHGWQVRPEPKKNVAARPDDVVERFFYDTILHSPQSLEFLVSRAGVSRVMLGSDYPYDMAMMDCVQAVRALSVSDADKDEILSGRARAVIGAGA